MSNSSEEESCTDETPDPEESTRGRPAGKIDSTKRYRRTAQEISDDRIKIAQMKLDALQESEERKLANKKTRTSRAKAVVEETIIPKAPKTKVVVRDESPPSPKLSGNRRQALYESWFTSGPRTRY